MFNMFENTNPPTLANDDLLLASAKGDLDGVINALNEGADPNYFPKEDSPLACAVRNGHKEISKILIERGANINVENRYQWRPFHEAARQGNMELLTLLVEHPMLIKTKRDADGHSALRVAVEHRHQDAVELILKHTSNVDSTDFEGNSTLMVAVKNDDFNMAQLLIKNGATIDLTNNDGISAADLSVDKPHFVALFGKAKGPKEEAAILEKETQNIEKKENMGMSVISKKKRPQ